MFTKDPIEQLKGMSIEPSAEALDRGRTKMLAFMAAHPFIHVTTVSWWQRSWFWKPATAFASIMMAVTGSGVAVSAAEGTVPGDSLYSVKLLAEEVRTRLAISVESRLRLRAVQAEHRLDEAEAVMLMPEEDGNDNRNNRIQVAMERYSNNLTALDAVSEKLLFKDDSDKTNQASKDAAREISRVLDKHLILVDSASSSLKTGSDLERRTREQSGRLREKLERSRVKKDKHKEDDKKSNSSDVSHDKNGGHTESHDHVEVERPTVRIPSINQPRILPQREIRAGFEMNVRIDNESRR